MYKEINRLYKLKNVGIPLIPEVKMVINFFKKGKV